MTGNEAQADLFPIPSLPEGTVIINDRCMMRTQDGHRVVIVSGIVLHQFSQDDPMAEAYTMVSLVEQGWADQNEVAKAFDCSVRTLRRRQRRFEDGGLSALGHAHGYPKGHRRILPSRSNLILRLKTEGQSNRAIAKRVGVDEKAVRKLLRRMGWKQTPPAQSLLPFGEASDSKLSAFQTQEKKGSSGNADPKLSAFSLSDEDPVPFTMDSDPHDRRGDRLMAYLGFLDDAAPLFRAGTRVAEAGVLLALPVLVASGVFQCVREIYGSIGPAFYGLRTSILALLLMALLRIRRPEGLKEHPPDEMGRVLGLDRAPEVKTLRRKLTRLAALGRATELGRELAKRRLAQRGAVMGFLYVDGHVRVYHGGRRIPKAHVARMRLSVPATTDYWVNDMNGDPLFVVTAEANAGMVKMLPHVLEEVRALVGEKQITVVFDRGGYSPALFQQLMANGFDILTYRKGRWPLVPKNQFHQHRAVLEGRKVSYFLADRGVRLLKGKLRLRQITRLSKEGHQTPILTSRRDLPAIQVAYRMFERWRQENFFKYMREEYLIDALVDYNVEPDDPERDVPNPQRAAIDAKLKEARIQLSRFQVEYGEEALRNIERTRPTMRGFKIAKGKLGSCIFTTMKQIASLEARRSMIPRRVPVKDVVEGQVVKLASERKLLTSLLKMIAYQAESDLVRMIASTYPRVEEEGRTLIQSALSSAADIDVSEGMLMVTLAPLSSAHRTRAIEVLCDELNCAGTIFPGSRLRLRYGVRPGR